MRRLPLLLLSVLLAGCARGDDDGRGAIPDVPAEAVDEAGHLRFTPAESAAAVRATEERARRLHDSVRAAAGPVGDDPPAPDRPSGPPSPRSYADCMAQVAEAAPPEERAVLEGICRRLPGAP